MRWGLAIVLVASGCQRADTYQTAERGEACDRDTGDAYQTKTRLMVP